MIYIPMEISVGNFDYDNRIVLTNSIGKEIFTEVYHENTLNAETYTGWVDFNIELVNA